MFMLRHAVLSQRHPQRLQRTISGYARIRNTDPNDPQMNIYEEARSPRVKKTLDVAPIYAEAGDLTTKNDSLYMQKQNLKDA